MVTVKKRKSILIIVLIYAVSSVTKCFAAEGVGQGVSSEQQSKGAVAVTKDQDSSDHRAPGQEDKEIDSSKVDNNESSAPTNVEDKNQIPEGEGGASRPSDDVEPKEQNEQPESRDQPSGEPEENKEETKSEDTDNPQEVIYMKMQNSKGDGNAQKINLNDVSTYTAKEDLVNTMKRETRYSDFLGLPRDSSYYFDDLEPFINNNSDNRISRSATSKENKNQKSKVNMKEKENIEVDLDDDDDESGNDEEDRSNEGEEDYDEDDDMDSDCQPMVSEGTTTPECTTTTCPPPTTTCPPPTTTCPPPTTTCPPPTTTCPPPTTTKSTTQFQCPTTCRSPSSSTKCPRICAKANRKKIGQMLTTEPTVKWDSDKKRFIEKKKRYRSKVNYSN